MQYAIFIFRFIYYKISSIQLRIKKNTYPVTPHGIHNINPLGTPVDNQFHVGVPRIIGGNTPVTYPVTPLTDLNGTVHHDLIFKAFCGGEI